MEMEMENKIKIENTMENKMQVKQKECRTQKKWGVYRYSSLHIFKNQKQDKNDRTLILSKKDWMN